MKGESERDAQFKKGSILNFCFWLSTSNLLCAKLREVELYSETHV